jgi:S-formylglutathione hydrolase FrmB
MRIIICFVLLCLFNSAIAGTVDTVNIPSIAMKTSFKAIVIKPETYKDKKSFPVVYLLHGHGGSFDNWIRLSPKLKDYADTYQLIIVCPDGGKAGWYFDSPIDSSMRYETYISKEVPAYIETNYNTIKDRKARAITGLSMGGHGGLFLGFRHADYFGACGSMSGALVIDYITRGYGVEKLLGDTIKNRQYYKDYSIMKEMEKFAKKDSVAVIIDCGLQDFILEMSRMVHQKMVTLQIPHDYIERPGKHEWRYWANAVQYQLLFFRNYFDRK